MVKKIKGKRGTQSGEVENIDTRIKGMTDRLTNQKKNKGDSIPELDKLYKIKDKKQSKQEKEFEDRFIKMLEDEGREEDARKYKKRIGRSEAQSGGMKAGGKVKAKKKTTRKFRGDGIARKGKTKGRFV
jgi:hypothetical protein